ncbi:hypothetical protein BDA96_06G021300 [Sorghum bicolor]|uniref:Uncharacterized protein n=2 Tax=Sorghum bicolor TaxID=4558 RepID=A0A921UBT6_SORBI|nr:hypothetical protein BDA96_06G021300 [Sorghum bicolor]KXG25833.1 hypothetical protein SORBI_3006G019400 [Sorghum bicolor]
MTHARAVEELGALREVLASEPRSCRWMRWRGSSSSVWGLDMWRSRTRSGGFKYSYFCSCHLNFRPYPASGMHTTCMWVVELLLVLSNIFHYVSEFCMESLVTLVIKHFAESWIEEFMLVFENNGEDVNKMPRSLLSAFNKRSWIPVMNILSRFCIVSTADAKFFD